MYPSQEAYQPEQPFYPGDYVEIGEPGSEEHDRGRIAEITRYGVKVCWASGPTTFVTPNELNLGSPHP